MPGKEVQKVLESEKKKRDRDCDDRKHCETTNSETICIPDTSMSGHHCKVHESVHMPVCPGRVCEKSYSQKSIHVRQQPLKLRIKKGCTTKKQDCVDVDVKVHDLHVKKNKMNVHVKAPKVHVARQKLDIEIIEGPKDKCYRPKVRVCVSKPKICVEEPEVCVRVDKGCTVTAPKPVICIKHTKRERSPRAKAN